MLILIQMQQRSCSYGEPTSCDGRMNDCPQCGDRVCDGHAVEGLCLACQDDEAEAQEETLMTKKQWDLLNEATSMATTLIRSEIEDCTRKKCDASMYERWMVTAQEAKEELIRMGAAARVFSQEVA